MNSNIEGWDELQRQLNAIAEANYTPALEKGVREAILPTMQSQTPVDTGDLLASEGVEVEGDVVSLVAGNNDVDYAVYVEMGTINMSAQPYMQPAIDTRKDEAMQIAAKEAEAIMKRVIQ